MKKVFISYSTTDHDFAEIVRLQLEAQGVEVWLDHQALHAGEDWKNALDDGIKSADVVLVILSENSFKSAYVTYEWAFAMGLEKKIVPILFQKSSVHPKLDALQMLDFKNTLNRPWQKLFDGLGIERDSLIAGDQPGKYSIAKDQILAYLNRKNFKMMSFERVRKNISPDYSDEFLDETIRNNHKDLRRSILEGGKAGVAKIKPE